MADKDRKSRNREASKRWRSEQNAQARSKFPLPSEQLEEMFNTLDQQLAVVECDHTLKLVKSWAWQRRLDLASLEAWLHDTGGYCDCEALANSEQAFREALRS